MKENEKAMPIGIENIKTKIHEIRGIKVMLDRDLAELYQEETKVLNQAVKRNKKRFPSDFMFQLTYQEFQILKSQIVTSSWGGIRKLPYAFTEQGLAMLSGLLNSDIAIDVNIKIMRTFVIMRHSISTLTQTNLIVKQIDDKVENLKCYIEDILHDQNDINEDTAIQLELINQTLAELQNDKEQRERLNERKPIGFKINK
ncbi:MAG: ORF6N domain-containing protein [Bacteroidales bacterium]|nr:ORF6N domain-containing protein [Bacteroidales bacterium]